MDHPEFENVQLNKKAHLYVSRIHVLLIICRPAAEDLGGGEDLFVVNCRHLSRRGHQPIVLFCVINLCTIVFAKKKESFFDRSKIEFAFVDTRMGWVIVVFIIMVILLLRYVPSNKIYFAMFGGWMMNL